uniref:Uncharacterized protein n=1 Tax=Anguilla anguilla TaxID=7936 RepID=A0A0E9R8K9_ANGAN
MDTENLKTKALVSEKRVGPVCDGRGSDPGVSCPTALAGEGGLLAPRHDWHLNGRAYGIFSSHKLA